MSTHGYDKAFRLAETEALRTEFKTTRETMQFMFDRGVTHGMALVRSKLIEAMEPIDRALADLEGLETQKKAALRAARKTR